MVSLLCSLQNKRKSWLTKHKKDKNQAAQGYQSLLMFSQEHCYQMTQLPSVSVCLRRERKLIGLFQVTHLPLGSKSSDSSQANGVYKAHMYVV